MASASAVPLGDGAALTASPSKYQPSSQPASCGRARPAVPSATTSYSARAAAAQEALELGIAPGRLALEQQGIREQLRQVPWQQTRAHGATPCTPMYGAHITCAGGAGSALMSQSS